jgi:hypothetical protein
MRTMTHELKCWPEFFCAIQKGDKTFDVRKGDDRKYKVGDKLLLREWSPKDEKYTGEVLKVGVTYVMHGGPFLPDDLWVLGLDLPRLLGREEGREDQRRADNHRAAWRDM